MIGSSNIMDDDDVKVCCNECRYYEEIGGNYICRKSSSNYIINPGWQYCFKFKDFRIISIRLYRLLKYVPFIIMLPILVVLSYENGGTMLPLFVNILCLVFTYVTYRISL